MGRRALLVLLAAGSSSCGKDDDLVACPAYAVAGLSVEVTNAATGQPICDAVVTITERQYFERLFETSCRFVGAYERPGTYVVRAERVGFVTRQLGSLRVVMGRGPCPHVQEVRVAIALTPEE
jgi:hypothetical protein